MHLVVAQPKQRLQGFYVLVVLMQWVLKLMVGSENFLSPETLMGAAENPALHILGFYNEHAKLRNQDVVNLRGAVRRGEGDVLDQVIAGFIQKQTSRGVNEKFANLAFEPG